MRHSAPTREGKTMRNARPLGDAAYEAVKLMIITLQLEPGAYLNEAQLAETIGMGRTPVRDAVKRLMHEGLLEILPRKGLIIKPIDIREIRDAIEVRLLNEPLCARLASEHATQRDIEAMRAIAEQSRQAVTAGENEMQMLLDRDFHCAMSEASGNKVLAGILGNLHDRALRFWFISLNNPTHAGEVCDQHEEILTALEARDPDRAEQAMHDHIVAFRDNVMDSLISGAGYGIAREGRGSA